MTGAARSMLRSFRDPDGRVVVEAEAVLRFVAPHAWQVLERFLASDEGKRRVDAGEVIATRPCEGAEQNNVRDRHPEDVAAFGGADCVIVRHDRVPFATYPYEWPPGMLHAAGRLTIALHASLLADGYGLKDATPFNVLFRGPDPVLIDVLSIEQREAGDPLWRADAQFLRTFILPLLAYRKLGLAPHERFLASREGWDPAALHRALGPLQRLSPGTFGTVTLPTWLSRSSKADDADFFRERRMDPDRAAFTLERNAKSRAGLLNRVAPGAPSATAWTAYESDLPYDEADHQRKIDFLARAFADLKPGAVLDMGSNTGRYSLMAAEAGARVVAIDSDPAVADILWHRARDGGANVLPLVGNLAAPTPATGWRNMECASLLDRARGQFDMVLALALFHHLVVTERVPVADVVGLWAELTRGHAVIEYVDPTDKNFRRISRGRDHLYEGLDVDTFRTALAAHFEVLEELSLGGGVRVMFRLAKRA